MKTKNKVRPLTAKRARYLKNKMGFNHLLNEIEYAAREGQSQYSLTRSPSSSYSKKLLALGYKIVYETPYYRIKW